MIAFKIQSQNAAAPAGIPDEWPWIEQIIEDGERDEYVTHGYTCLSADSYVLYKESYRPQYEAWCATLPIQFDNDREKFLRRAGNLNQMLADVAAGNMARVRSGLWTVNDLISLTQDSNLMAIMSDIHVLSFEIAYQKIDGIDHVLITPDIKEAWKKILMDHFYNS